MTKLIKAVMYIIDHDEISGENEINSYEEIIKDILSMEALHGKVIVQRVVNLGEIDDDHPVNKRNCSVEQYEKFLQGEVEFNANVMFEALANPEEWIKNYEVIGNKIYRK